MRKRKIAYVSGTRADFGLMVPVLRAMEKSKSLDLQVYATGMHLMPEFGRTIKEVKEEFPKTKVIAATFKKDDKESMAVFATVFLNKFAQEMRRNRPDLTLTLGDRPEMLCVALASLYLGIPTGHIHGGERTSTVDEIARHAITKLSHLHFAATLESAKRIEKLGEEKWRIHVVGAPALDVILNEKLPTREELCRKLGLKPDQKIILLTQHPVSGEENQAAKQMEEIIAAIKKFNLQVVVIYPNADPGARRMIRVIERERHNPRFHIYKSLPYKRFLALEREAAVWVGNSSAAMIESSSFGTPVVNMGTRQIGRQRGENVIDVDYDKCDIISAINKSLNDGDYLKKLKTIKNPWGDGKTGPRIARILEEVKIDSKLLTKQITY